MITLYTKPDCPYCDKAKLWLDQHGFSYQTVNVREDASALAFIRAQGHSTVPQIYAGPHLLVAGGYTGLEKTNPTTLRQSLNDLLPNLSRFIPKPTEDSAPGYTQESWLMQPPPAELWAALRVHCPDLPVNVPRSLLRLSAQTPPDGRP